jgi:ankyrin repeat protein
MNIKILATLTISFLSIAASLFCFGVIAPQLISIIIAALTACLAAIFTTMIIAYVVQKQFQHAVYTGKLEHMLPYIKYGANPNYASNVDGDTPLQLATKNNHADIVLKLIQAGADVNFAGRRNNTPLHIAAQNGYTEIVLKLIQAGANVNLADTWKNTPLHLAAENGHTETVEALIDKGANPYATDQNRNTPLHKAAKKGHTETVEALIDKGANPNATDQNGNTPLHKAAKKGHTETVAACIENGAKANVTNRHGNTPLHFAANTNVLSTSLKITQAIIQERLDYLNSTSVKTTEVRDSQAHIPIIAQYAQTIEKLIEAGAKIHVTNDHGETPLHEAAKGKYNATLVSVLIDLKADPDAKDRNGHTPLHLAAQKGHTETVAALIENGANRDDSDEYGNTPLHFAAQAGHTKTALILIDKGANPNATAIDRKIPGLIPTAIDHKKPLRKAAQNDHAETVLALIKKGVDINDAITHASDPVDGVSHNTYAPTWTGTLLHWAIGKAHTEIALELMQAGADVNATDSKGRTPLYTALKGLTRVKLRGNLTKIAIELIKHGANIGTNIDNLPILCWTAQNGHIQILSELIEKGANIHATNQNGDTPLHLAAQNGHTKTAVLLIENGADVNTTNRWNATPLRSAVTGRHTEVVIELIKKGANIDHYSLLSSTMCKNHRATTLAIIHYGKVPYTNIPVIEGNRTSDYIQRQYQRAQRYNSRYAKRLFCCMQSDYGDIIRLQIQIWAMITKDTNLYRKIRILLRNVLPTDLLRIVLQYAGLLPPNHHIDLNALMIPPCSSNILLPHTNPAIHTTGSEPHNDMATYHNPSETGGAPSR